MSIVFIYSESTFTVSEYSALSIAEWSGLLVGPADPVLNWADLSFPQWSGCSSDQWGTLLVDVVVVNPIPPPEQDDGCGAPAASILLGQLAYDAAFTFMTDFGEPIIYTPAGGDPVRYQGVVFREEPAAVAGLIGAAAYRHQVFLPNDPNGITGPATINKGNDVVTLPNRPYANGPTEDFVVLEIIDSDQGMWRLGCGEGR